MAALTAVVAVACTAFAFRLSLGACEAFRLTESAVTSTLEPAKLSGCLAGRIADRLLGPAGIPQGPRASADPVVYPLHRRLWARLALLAACGQFVDGDHWDVPVQREALHRRTIKHVTVGAHHLADDRHRG